MEHFASPAAPSFKEDLNSGIRMGLGHDRVVEILSDSLRATGLEHRALRPGDKAPDVTLVDAVGSPTTLSDLWKKGPVVVVFYRGGWCPYCSQELHGWQEHLGELRRLGATLVAISPETPLASMTTARRIGLDFMVLSDSELKAANGFEVAYTLPAELIDLYAAGGINLPVLNGSGSWVLPVPATFVVDTTGHVQFAHVDVDYRHRADPKDVLAVVDHLQELSAA